MNPPQRKPSAPAAIASSTPPHRRSRRNRTRRDSHTRSTSVHWPHWSFRMLLTSSRGTVTPTAPSRLLLFSKASPSRSDRRARRRACKSTKHCQFMLKPASINAFAAAGFCRYSGTAHRRDTREIHSTAFIFHHSQYGEFRTNPDSYAHVARSPQYARGHAHTVADPARAPRHARAKTVTDARGAPTPRRFADRNKTCSIRTLRPLDDDEVHYRPR